MSPSCKPFSDLRRLMLRACSPSLTNVQSGHPSKKSSPCGDGHSSCSRPVTLHHRWRRNFVPLLIHSPDIQVVAVANASLSRRVPSLVTWFWSYAVWINFGDPISYWVFHFVEGRKLHFSRAQPCSGCTCLGSINANGSMSPVFSSPSPPTLSKSPLPCCTWWSTHFIVKIKIYSVCNKNIESAHLRTSSHLKTAEHISNKKSMIQVEHPSHQGD